MLFLKQMTCIVYVRSYNTKTFCTKWDKFVLNPLKIAAAGAGKKAEEIYMYGRRSSGAMHICIDQNKPDGQTVHGSMICKIL